MKLPTLLSFSLLILASCTPKTDPNTRDVSVIKDPEYEKYYVKTTELHKLLRDKGQAVVKFQFRGSTLAATRHNESQAKAVAWATRQADLINDQFDFTLSGSKAKYTQREPFLRHLALCGVRLQQAHIGPVSNLNSNVVEDQMANKTGEADLITVTIKRLK